jgi:hypothetical protein
MWCRCKVRVYQLWTYSVHTGLRGLSFLQWFTERQAYDNVLPNRDGRFRPLPGKQKNKIGKVVCFHLENMSVQYLVIIFFDKLKKINNIIAKHMCVCVCVCVCAVLCCVFVCARVRKNVTR